MLRRTTLAVLEASILQDHIVPHVPQECIAAEGLEDVLHVHAANIQAPERVAVMDVSVFLNIQIFLFYCISTIGGGNQYSGSGWGACNTCSACGAGTYVLSWCNSCGNINCVNCPVGQYQSNSQYTYCFNCIVGQYQPYAGQGACYSCPAGQYQGNQAQTGCNSCPNGQYSTASASGCSCVNAGMKFDFRLCMWFFPTSIKKHFDVKVVLGHQLGRDQLVLRHAQVDNTQQGVMLMVAVLLIQVRAKDLYTHTLVNIFVSLRLLWGRWISVLVSC